MMIFLTIIHVLICLLLVAAVLLQSGKGGGLAGSIGGGLSSTSVLGGRSASTFLTKATAVLATAFMLICVVQAITYDTPEGMPTTASERILEESGASMEPEKLFNETDGLPLKEAGQVETDSEKSAEAGEAP
jgi:preprotein translocase subunit SecG